MAANRPNLGLQIALIIFVLITIALGVSTVIFFNQNKESLAAEKTAKEAQAKADQDKKDAEDAFTKVLDIVKGLDANRPAPAAYKGKVDPVIDDFKKHMVLYGATFTEAANSYPLMLQHSVDAYVAAQARLAEKDKEIAKLTAEKDAIALTIKNVEETYKTKAAELATASDGDRKLFVTDRETFEGEKQALAQSLEKKNADVKAALDEKDDMLKKVKEQVVKQRTLIQEKTDRITEFNKVDFKAPDGTIVRVNQRERTVWIDRGRADGIKPQMIFSVHDRSSENIAGDVKEKGAIEVIRILDAHLSECAITKDDIKDPLMKEDKIMNPAYLAGQPEHFAVAGFIDLDGDGQSDMNRVLTLISNNGGVVDAMIDDDGKMTGAITAATKLLVVGESPTDVKGQDSLKSYTRMMKDADDAKIQKMPLSDFIKYMGYQGRERSIPLGKEATDVPAGTFKKRPTAGAGGAFP